MAAIPNQTPGQGPSNATQPSGNLQSNLWLIVALCIALAILGAALWKYFTPPGSENTTTTGLKYVDQVVGNGESPSPGKTVLVHYTGWLENGTKFDSSVDRFISRFIRFALPLTIR